MGQNDSILFELHTFFFSFSQLFVSFITIARGHDVLYSRFSQLCSTIKGKESGLSVMHKFIWPQLVANRHRRFLNR